ncbi:hypothetical protein L208DRAFT_1375534 [Tricholoma matsutake]|nr:hypothetical protein L208DRAFT_1375534 [Tricholoma matsutake 945]
MYYKSFLTFWFIRLVYQPLTQTQLGCGIRLLRIPGAITCFQHDEYKALSGSDGNLKMWDVRDGVGGARSVDGGHWGRWCVAASNRNDVTVIDVLGFGDEVDGEWVEEPRGAYMFIRDDDDDDEDDMGPWIRRMTAVGIGPDDDEGAFIVV